MIHKNHILFLSDLTDFLIVKNPIRCPAENRRSFKRKPYLKCSSTYKTAKRRHFPPKETSCVGRALEWWSGGHGFKPHWGQFLMKFILSYVTIDLSDNLTEMRQISLSWKTRLILLKLVILWWGTLHRMMQMILMTFPNQQNRRPLTILIRNYFEDEKFTGEKNHFTNTFEIHWGIAVPKTMSSLLWVLSLSLELWVDNKFEFLVDLYSSAEVTVADLKGPHGRAPPLGQNVFIFMQFSGKIGQIVGWRSLWGCHTPFWEVLDPPSDQTG